MLYASIYGMHPSTKKPENVVDFIDYIEHLGFKSKVKVLIGKSIKCSTAIFEILGRGQRCILGATKMLLFLSNSSKYQAYQISKMNFSKNTARKSQRNVLQAPKSLLGQYFFFEKYRSFDPSKLNKDNLYTEKIQSIISNI